MNPINSNLFTQLLLNRSAHDVYSSGREAEAAKIYAESAEHSRENRDIAGEMEAKRWQGNSLMWSARHEEALQVLLEVATCDHPEADPGSVFGAKTDCIMLSLYHAQASACRALINDSARYLEVIGKTHWRHRLNLLTCMLLMKQWRLAEAAAAIAPAYRLMKAAVDGPRYSDFSYFKWNARPAFFLRQDETLAHWERVGVDTPFSMVSDRLRMNCIRLFRFRLRRATGAESPELLEVARQSAHGVQESQFMWDENFDIARALMLAGDTDTIARLPINQITLFPFDRAALETELKINSLRNKLKLVPWDAELNWPASLPDRFTAKVQITPAEAHELEQTIAKLKSVAQAEDARMETSQYAKAAQIREDHALELLRLVTIKPA